jgi:REP element-mobilizing transposase RayT
VIDADGNIIPETALLDFVQEGMHDPKARRFDKRYNLGEAFVPGANGNNLALPTDTWREYVERRKRCLELRALLQGDISSGRDTDSGTDSDTESDTESGTGVSPVTPSPPLSQLFQPFDPSQPVDITQRNLPHWQQEGVPYFVTFRLADSLPQAKLQQWHQEKEAWLKRNPPPWSEAQQAEYAEQFPHRLNEWLDAGAGSCLLKEATAGKIVEDALHHFDGERYSLDHYVVMPNHVHALVAPQPGFKLPDILHSWKSFTAHQINKALHRKGTLWFDESYDHIVRSRQQLEFYRAYIRENPQKANLRPGQFRLGTSQALDGII